MNLVEQINAHQYLYLVDIREPDINVLRIVIDEAPAGESETRTLEIDETDLSEYKPIVSDVDCRRYEIIFRSYIAYAVRNESYVVMDQSEVFTGRLFNVYSQSLFLDYVRAATIASSDYPGPFVHYGMNCLNHIVDVISLDEPVLGVVNRAQSSHTD